MQPGTEDRDRTASTVEGGVGNELVVNCGVELLGDFVIVVRFQNLFRAVIQSTVTVQDSRAARRQEFLVDGRNTADHAGQAESVVAAAPSFPVYAHAQRRSVIYVREHPCLVMTIVPAYAREHADVLRNFLFPVQPKAVFAARGVRQGNVSPGSKKCRLVAA